MGKNASRARTLSRLRAAIDAIEPRTSATPGMDGVFLWPGVVAPRAILHEVRADDWRHLGAATGFALGLAIRAAGHNAPRVVFVEKDHEARSEGALYGCGLAAFGFDPAHAIFIRARSDAEFFWAGEEAARIPGAGAVVMIARGQGSGLNLTATRRLNLAAREGGALTVLIRKNTSLTDKNVASAAPWRWRVAPARSGRGLYDARASGAPAFSVIAEKSSALAARVFTVEWRHDASQFVLRSQASRSLSLDAASFNRFPSLARRRQNVMRESTP